MPLTHRLPIVLALCLALAVALPAAAHASWRQHSLIQDENSFLYGLHGDPFQRMAEARNQLGANIIKVYVFWNQVAPAPTSKTKPPGFDARNPGSPGYSWALYDRFMANAERLGFRIMVTPTGPIPHWASHRPARCGSDTSCGFRPDAREFAQFVEAIARRYQGRIRYWSIWNEPNLGGWLQPQYERGRRVRASARIYRLLWLRAWRAIRRHDPGSRGSVLFGETAPFGNPVPFLRWALCLDARGRPRASRAQGCPRRPARLPVAAFAHHPYSAGGIASPRARIRRGSNITLAYLPRLHRISAGAARHRRIRGRKPVFITEYGFQTNPPDRFAPRPRTAAGWMNASSRLIFTDQRVKAMAQFELLDPADPNVFNTGLRFANGARKPSWGAYRMPLFVTRLGRNAVEVWGQVKPARGRVRVSVYARRKGGRYRRQRTKTTNPRGLFRVRIRKRGAARFVYQLRHRSSGGDVWFSRVARSAPRMRYRR